MPLYAFCIKGRFILGWHRVTVVNGFIASAAIKGANHMKNSLLTIDEDTLDLVIESLKAFSLWLALGIAVALAVAFSVVFFKKKDAMPTLKKFAVGVVVGFSVTLVAVFLFIQLSRLQVKGKIDASFWLFIGFFITLLLLVLAGALLKKFAPKAYTYFVYIAFAVVIVYAVILCMNIINAKAYKNYEIYKNSGVLYYVLSFALVAIIVALAFIFGKDEGTANTAKNLAYAGVCIALSFALSYVKFFSLPMGGSVTLASMLPLMLYAYMFGARKGVFAGLIYGVLQFIQNPSVYQWMQILLDFPIAFSALGLAGIAKKFKFLKGNMIAEIMVGMVIAVLFRYAAHVISGYFVFWTWSTMDSPLAYSFAYNSFTLVDLAIDIVAAALLLASKSVRDLIANVNPKAVAAPEKVEATVAE